MFRLVQAAASCRALLSYLSVVILVRCHTYIRSVVLCDYQVGSSGGRLVGIAKGAGMIEPDMATMLVYLVTDLQVRGGTYCVGTDELDDWG